MKVVAVKSTGAYVGRGFVTRVGGCNVEEFTREAYPYSKGGITLRYLRAEVGLSCGQAARILGLTPAELSGVEWGRMTFENEADFEQAETMLRAKFVAPRGTTPPPK